jgi:hypothetical protein
MADAQSVTNKLDGSSGTDALPWALVARLYEAHMFGLSSDYAFPEGSNTTSSRLDSITTLDKLLSRKMTLSDGNQYDLWDCVFTITKWIVAQNPSINDDEPNSVNYKAAK